MKRTYEDALEKGRVLVYGVSANESIKRRILPIYSDEKLEEGKLLHQQAKEAFTSQTKEITDSLEATRIFNTSKDSIHNSVVKMRKASRYFFNEDTAIYMQLFLDKNIPDSYASWRIFVEENIHAALNNSEAIAKIQVFSFSSEKLMELLTELTQLDDLKLSAERESGEAQQSTVTKHNSYANFIDYCSDLKKCLKLFYDGDDSQKLEEVGIVVK